jgi:hypothetical protein
METALGYVLTLADKEAFEITRELNGNGQGALIQELSNTTLAKAERASYKGPAVDTSYLSKFQGTDYCQWVGRQSDGRFYPIGRILKIIKVEA